MRTNGRNNEVMVVDRATSRVVWRRETPTPKRLGRRVVARAAGLGWSVDGRSAFHELRSDVGSYTYWLRRRDPETGVERQMYVEVVFPIASETFTGAV